MNRALINKCLRECWALLAAIAATLFAFCWVRVWLVSRLDTSRFKAIVDLLPGDWKRFSPVDMEWLVTYDGRVALAYDEPIVVFGMSIWAIARGSDVISGELNRGTMEMLLAQPLSRSQILWTQAVVTLLGAALISCSAWFGTFVGVQACSAKEEVRPTWTLPVPLPWLGREIPQPLAPLETRHTPMSEKVDSHNYWPAAFNLFSLGAFLCGFSTLVSACDRYRWRTIGVVVGAYVVQTVMKLVGMASDDWAWMRPLSIFTAYEPEAFVQLAVERPELAWSVWRVDEAGVFTQLGPLGYDLIFLVLGYLAYLAAAVIFHRRDLPAPL